MRHNTCNICRLVTRQNLGIESIENIQTRKWSGICVIKMLQNLEERQQDTNIEQIILNSKLIKDDFGKIMVRPKRASTTRKSSILSAWCWSMLSLTSSSTAYLAVCLLQWLFDDTCFSKTCYMASACATPKATKGHIIDDQPCQRDRREQLLNKLFLEGGSVGGQNWVYLAFWRFSPVL